MIVLCIAAMTNLYFGLGRWSFLSLPLHSLTEMNAVTVFLKKSSYKSEHGFKGE